MDEASFRALFEAQFADVWRFARRRCPSAHQADDVVAETFAVAWRRRDGLPTGADTRLWLFGTARLVLANQRRSDERRARLDERLARQPGPAPGGDPAGLVTDADGRRLGRALAALSSDDRELLVMRGWDGLAVTEIATLLGCTPNAASGRLHRARARLAAALGGDDPVARSDAGPEVRPPGRVSDPQGGRGR